MLCQKETKASLTTYKEKMAQAYDFALDKMGLDIQSFSLWSDYIKFLKVWSYNTEWPHLESRVSFSRALNLE